MITYEQLDAVIPRVPAGIDSGDLTDPDERPAFVSQVLGWVLRASTTAPTTPDAADGDRAPKRVKMAAGGVLPLGGRYVLGEGTGVSVAWGVDRAEVTVDPELEALLDEEEAHFRRNAWIHQPPKPGTHESDLADSGAIYRIARVDDPTRPHTDASLAKYRVAAAWSQENAR